MDSFSGAAMQASLLSKHLQKPIIFFNSTTSESGLTINEGRICYNYNTQYRFKTVIVIVILTKLLGIRIYHLHGFNKTGIVCSIISRVKLILKSTMMNEDDLLTISSSKINRFFVRKIDKVISISNPIFQANENAILRLKFKIENVLIPNGVNIPRFYENIKKPEFLIVGVVCARKNTKEGIQFFLNNFPQCKLKIIGPDKIEDGLSELDKKYLEECKSISTNNSVEYLGKVSKREIESHYQSAIALIHLSKNEGLPNTVLEAISFNCVPITSKINGIAEDIIDNGVDGFILNNFKEKISYDMVKTISDSKAARKKALKFDIIEIAKLHMKNYES